MGRPIHGKPLKFYYFLKRDLFDSDWSAMHKCQETVRYARISKLIKI